MDFSLDRLLELFVFEIVKLYDMLILKQVKRNSGYTKSDVNLRRKEIEFQIGDIILLKVSPWKKVLQFGRKGKLSLWFFGLYKIIEKNWECCILIEPYRIHNCRSDPSSVITLINPATTYSERLIEILAVEAKN
ncbi:DNA/RNA polymerase superfamily protein [Gossypium australe]|uniref:DNA/RNA polymerase superfamily protein n=1 Tax=Gossypium australe TaxID=47621 RepID=A0A5B6VXV6_9ROSI|nr:DNA/RNA polymerase superfamily protein [Gossypium australe]